MEQTQLITVVSFLLMTLLTLLFALWLFKKFMFTPVNQMISDMDQITHGKLHLTVDNSGLREFHLLANAFNSMNEQVRMRTNDLQQLLDLDDSALLCFDHDRDIVYFNNGAANLFGYTQDESYDLDLSDLFKDDISTLINNSLTINYLQTTNLRTQLNCKHKDGQVFQSSAIITVVDVMGKNGLAIALNKEIQSDSVSSIKDQRLSVVEQTLSRLLSFSEQGKNENYDQDADSKKLIIREQVVNLMNLSLNCWTQDTGSTKLDLAEQSGIWPIYIDKSTPTTRTLDKYLTINSCPKNPRNQRVIDTAEFVLKETSQQKSDKHLELEYSLDSFRQLLAGL
ncbi:MAG: hypothetical protein DRQ47_01695 [Gammaproteobacteria bacterium]|nr:MAG: hypothetical protein DRQ47_01695 [Gammaproteobacteria bacterium]